ncbi:MAG: hypothetical protein RIS94_629 [Pseudomonadota bacterium]|jgi:anti-sigma factor RsiW
MIVTDHQLSAWLSGSLTPDEAARIAAAVEADPVLSARAERLGQLDDLVRQAVPLQDGVPDALLARLGLAPAERPADVTDIADARQKRAATVAERRRPTQIWRIAAQVALVAGIGLAAMQFLPDRAPQQPQDAYRALSDERAPRIDADALVLFASGTTADQARAIVLAAGGSVVGSPTETGAIRVKAGADRDDMLARLRARPEVTMAESLDAGRP